MRYQYSCSQCGQGVTKPETGTSISKSTKAGLHGWKCPVHGAVKVVRKMNKDGE
jgi:DNA-directed RNA polymerase subunit RPC12/RpoP